MGARIWRTKPSTPSIWTRARSWRSRYKAPCRANKAELAINLDAGVIIAVTLHGANRGDTTTLDQTLCEAGMAVAEQVGREAELRPNEAPKVKVARSE